MFWFSANETGPETAAEQALIANYSVAVLSWELQTKGADPWRRTDTKMRALSAGLRTTAPGTEVLMYMQGQLAMDWYEVTRAMLPPPCGTDSAGAFDDFWLLDNATHRPARWPSPKGSTCRGLNGSDLSYDFGQAEVREYFVQHIVLPFADAPNVKGVFLDDADSVPCASDLCNSFNGLHYWPCGAAARDRLFNGTVAWTKDVTRRLNARGQIPVFNSNNDPNASTAPPGARPHYGESNCPRSSTQVHAEFDPVSSHPASERASELSLPRVHLPRVCLPRVTLVRTLTLSCDYLRHRPSRGWSTGVSKRHGTRGVPTFGTRAIRPRRGFRCSFTVVQRGSTVTQ